MYIESLKGELNYLQKKYEIKTFPQIQFIISTHSRYIVKSVRNSKIYDMTLNRMLERHEWLHDNED